MTITIDGAEESQGTSLYQQLDPVLVQQAMTMIQSAQRIALLAHENPDGDCIGSALGLAHILTLIGKTCVPVCIHQAPGTLSYLPGLEQLQHSLGDENFDLVIALDAGELSRYGSLHEQHRAFLERVPILNIDHHISSSGCGQVNIIDVTAAATAEILGLFQQQAALPINQDAALCLLTGIITDTGSFQYSSTTPRTMEVGAQLLRAGAVPETVVKPIYRVHKLAQMRFQSMVILQAQTSCEGRLIWSQGTDQMLCVGCVWFCLDDNFSGLLRDIEGVEIAAFFKSYEDPHTTRLSLRCAEPYNAAEICQRIANGGGHARAGGGTLFMPVEKAINIVVSALEEEIRSKGQR